MFASVFKWFIGLGGTRAGDVSWFKDSTQRHGNYRAAHHRSGVKNALRRCGFVGAVVAAVYGAHVNLAATVIVGGVVVALSVIAGLWLLQTQRVKDRNADLLGKFSDIRGLETLKSRRLKKKRDTYTLTLPRRYDATPRRQADLNSVVERHTGDQYMHTFNFKTRRATFKLMPPPPTTYTWAEAQPIVETLTETQTLVGLDGRRQPKIIDVSVNPHIAMSAGTGAGKSHMLGIMILQWLRPGRTTEQVTIIDVKKTSLNAFLGLKRVRILKDYAEINNAICNELSIMQQREDADSEVVTSTTKWPRRYLVFDEANSYMKEIALWWDNYGQASYGQKAPKLCPSIDALQTLLIRARAVGIHVVYCGQYLNVASTAGGHGATAGKASRQQYSAVMIRNIGPTLWTQITGRKEAAMPNTPVQGRWVFWNQDTDEVDTFQMPYLDMEGVQAVAQEYCEIDDNQRPVVLAVDKQAEKKTLREWIDDGVVPYRYEIAAQFKSKDKIPWETSGKKQQSYLYTKRQILRNLEVNKHRFSVTPENTK